MHAQNPSHDKWLPFNEQFTFENIYFDASAQLNFPFVFDGKANYSGWGLGFGIEAGYDWGGWLFGLRYAHLLYGQGAMVHSFNHNMLTLEISKLFTKYHIPFFPEWLDMRLNFGFGVDFSKGSYYKNSATQSAKLTSEERFSTMMLSTGLFCEYTPLPLLTPYLGLNFDFTPDMAGIFFFPAVSLGFRTTIGKVKASLKEPEPQIIEVPVIVEVEVQVEKEPPLQEESLAQKAPVAEKQDFSDDYKITLQNIIFDPDAATFEKISTHQKRSNERALEIVIKALNKFPERTLLIKGYANTVTGAQERAEDLESLSVARANAVMQILVERGVDPARLVAIGMGGENPLETTRLYSWQNRRVEFEWQEE